MNPSASVKMPSRKGLLLATGGSLVVAAVILAGFILPAEYHLDPTGLGKAMGLMALSQPAATAPPASSQPVNGTAARTYAMPFRTDEIKIPLKGDQELEYKVRMAPGGTLVYSWATNTGQVYYDFHSEPTGDPKHTISHATGITNAGNGSLIAPFGGIHGWFLQNQEGTPIVVTLKFSGFYELRASQDE